MYIDIILGIMVALGFYVGYGRGIIKTVFAILSLLVAVLAAMKLSPIMINFLDRFLTWDPRLIVILGFVLTFIIVVIAIRFLGTLLEKMMAKLQINFVNKLAGGLVMAFVFTLLYSCALWFMDETRLLSPSAKSSSITYVYLKPMPQGVAAAGRKIKPVFESFWNKTAEAMDEVRENSMERDSIGSGR